MEALRFQIFLWLLNYWRMYRPEHFDMADAWREICESMPPIPVCALEGCDELVFSGVPWIALYCCQECRDKARRETQEYRAYHKAYMKAYKAYKQTPEYKAYHKAYMKNYYARKKAERLAAEEQTSP